MNLMVKVTSMCNYACGMCPYHGDEYGKTFFLNRSELQRDMSLGEVEIILQKAREAGVETIDWTPNGEFFAYKNWREALMLAQKYKMRSSVITNGGLLREQDIRDAVDLGLSLVAVSIDSVNYDTYKVVRKPASKQAFENAINAPIFFKQYSDSKISSGGGGEIYVQVQFTEQPENKNEIQDMLNFYRPHKLDQISVNKMSIYNEKGSVLVNSLRDENSYEVGTCKSYGTYMILTDGSVMGCCDEVHFYPKLRDKIPNIFKQSLEECKRQSDYLYLNDETFINYCKNCSVYHFSGLSEKKTKSIKNEYLEIASRVQTRYFLIPEYLKNIPDDILLFMYENNMVSAIKNFKRNIYEANFNKNNE